MVNDIRVLTDQSGFQPIDQGFLSKGLPQERDCRQHLRTRRLVSKTRLETVSLITKPEPGQG
jgi:hypothetical protein